MRMEVDRASGTDLLNLAIDVGPFPMNAGACLILDGDVADIRRVVAERVQAIPRLRQRLVRAPFGCGRPFWADDPAFKVEQHLRVVPCAPPGDERALLDLAAEVIGERLATSRPLWSMRLVTGLAGGRTGLIVCFHHVLADGIGGLAVLAGLVDGAASPPIKAPRARPSLRTLAAEAWGERLRVIARLPRAWRTVRQAMSEVRALPHPARCSLNRPVGRNQRLAVVSAPLEAVRAYAHACGGTVNDALLAAVTGAVRAVLAGRGEALTSLVVSVLVSARTGTTADRLGNQIGVRYVSLPAEGVLADRLAATAVITRAEKAAARTEVSGELVAAVNRVFARLHVVRWMTDHQRLFHTVVSNMRGPAEPLTLAGAPIRAITPISFVRGNVTVAFTVLSYAGTLTVTIAADVDRVPDLPVLIAALDGEFAAMRTGAV